MSRLCENCRRRIYLPRFPTAPIVRADPVTGYTCKFCSDGCVREWTARSVELVAAVGAPNQGVVAGEALP